MTPPTPIVITDTSVLINFLVIDRVELLHKCGHHFLLTDHVVSEVTAHYPEQLRRLTTALQSGMLEKISVIETGELEMFQRLLLSGRLGLGECSAIAVAIARRHILAIDDRRAKKEASAIDSALKIIGTQDLMVLILRAGLLNVPEADGIKFDWATKHSFTLKIGSFADLL